MKSFIKLYPVWLILEAIKLKANLFLFFDMEMYIGIMLKIQATERKNTPKRVKVSN